MNQDDIDELAKIYSVHYPNDFPLNLGNTFDHIVASKDNVVLGFGWLQLIVEANIILNLDARERDKFAALKAIIEFGQRRAKVNGFDQMHIFPKDPKFIGILKNHLNFTDISGGGLVLNLKE